MTDLAIAIVRKVRGDGWKKLNRLLATRLSPAKKHAAFMDFSRNSNANTKARMQATTP